MDLPLRLLIHEERGRGWGAFCVANEQEAKHKARGCELARRGDSDL